VEKVATIAVMAGAKPGYLPAILALSSANPSYGSTTSMAKMTVVSGPYAKEIGMNSGTAALGPFNQANTVIGRACTLMSKILGNSHLTGKYVSSMSSPLNYNNVCFAENEEGLPPGWNPIRVTLGFKTTDSIITTGSGWNLVSSSGEICVRPPSLWIRDLCKPLSANGSRITVLVDPIVATYLYKEGFTTKEKFAQWLSDNIEITAEQYWGNGVITAFMSPLARQGLEPYATWYKAPPETLIKPFNDPKAINVVVVGGEKQGLFFVTDLSMSGKSIDAWK
jgi:hypothetical protein